MQQVKEAQAMLQKRHKNSTCCDKPSRVRNWPACTVVHPDLPGRSCWAWTWTRNTTAHNITVLRDYPTTGCCLDWWGEHWSSLTQEREGCREKKKGSRKVCNCTAWNQVLYCRAAQCLRGHEACLLEHNQTTVLTFDVRSWHVTLKCLSLKNQCGHHQYSITIWAFTFHEHLQSSAICFSS